MPTWSSLLLPHHQYLESHAEQHESEGLPKKADLLQMPFPLPLPRPLPLPLPLWICDRFSFAKATIQVAHPREGEAPHRQPLRCRIQIQKKRTPAIKSNQKQQLLIHAVAAAAAAAAAAARTHQSHQNKEIE